MAAEGVDLGLDQLRTPHVFARNGGDHVWAALYRGALHQMPDGAHTTQLFATASAAGTPMFEGRQRRAMTR